MREDLQIHTPNKLESVFIELLIPSKPSLILGTIYKHPSMQHFKFNSDFMKILLNKVSLENKRSLIVGEFNLNLIKYRQITGVNQFLEVTLTNNFTPQITLPTRINQKPANLTLVLIAGFRAGLVELNRGYPENPALKPRKPS